MKTEFAAELPPETPHLSLENGPLSSQLIPLIEITRKECGKGSNVEFTLWRYFVISLYLEAKSLPPQAFETQFFQMIETTKPEQRLENETLQTQPVSVAEKQFNRRAFLHGAGVVAKETAIISAISSSLLAGYTLDYTNLPEILETIFAPEEQIDPDTGIIEYNPQTFFNRAIAVIGNSNTGHSDKKGDMANRNDQHPPQMMLVNDMEKRFSELHWQLFYFGENGADEKQIMEQVQSPLFQLINGQPVHYLDLVATDDYRRSIGQRPLNREIKIYITERTDPALRVLVEKYNKKKNVPNNHLYPFKIESQQDITIIQKVLKKIKAIDVGKSTEGDNLVNAIQLNPEHPEYGKLLETVENPKENMMKRVAAACLIFHLAGDALKETADDETKLYLYLHDLNKKSRKPFIETIVSYKTPSLQGQKDFVMGHIESNGQTEYTVANIPQDAEFQTAISGISKGINNAGARGYEMAKLILQGKGEKFLSQIIRLQAPTGLAYVDHQHFTDLGYAWLKEQIKQRTKYLGQTLEALVNGTGFLLSRRDIFNLRKYKNI